MAQVKIFINGECIGELTSCTLNDYEMQHSNDPETLKQWMEEAVEKEDYEAAAHYRDLLNKYAN